MTVERYVGLDIETTGSDVNKHGLIQIGVFVSKQDSSMTGELFVSDVRPWPWVEHDEQATAVHRISRERQFVAPPSEVVDVRLCEWLTRHDIGVGKGSHAVHPVGFNVGSFDMPFVRKFLPHAFERFSYRCVDLNTLLFGMHEAFGDAFDFTTMKKRAKNAAEKYLSTQHGLSPMWHDAGYDAAASYYAWRFLLAVLHGAPL